MQNEPIPEYTPEPECPKCGWTDMGLTFREGWYEEWKWIAFENLKCKCTRCGYFFSMKTKAAPCNE
jgi:hypothetical protein